jgi:hypothetical protein
MKKTQNQGVRQNAPLNANKQRPEIRDNLDSRKNEEQDFKGDDVTHNSKPHQNKHPEKKK